MSDLIVANGPLQDFRAPSGLGLTAGPPSLRYVLRVGGDASPIVHRMLGFVLPQTACRAASSGERHALWLGPDEWLLLTPPNDGLVDLLGAALGDVPHALVEVSCRQTSVRVSGPRVLDLIGAGCPLDLGLLACPVGFCSRTVFGKAEIVLWRRAEMDFHIEVWRSFRAYLWNLLLAADAQAA